MSTINVQWRIGIGVGGGGGGDNNEVVLTRA